jgi:hypothetical protein
MIFVAVCFLSLGSISLTARFSARPPLGPDGCVVGAPPTDAVAVFVDTSDPLSARDQAAVASHVEHALDTAEEYSWFAVYGLGRDRIERSYERCVPRRPSTANPLTENTEVIEVEYKAQFTEQVRNKLSEVLSADLAQSSPIADAIADLAAAPRFAGASGARRIVMVTDGVINTAEFSLYEEDATFETFRQSDPRPTIKALAGAEIVWVRIDRHDNPELINRTERFWRDFASYHGAQLVLAQRPR